MAYSPMSMTSVHASARRSSPLLAAILICVASCGGAAAKIARTAPPTLTVSDERRCHFDRSHGAIFGTLKDRETYDVLAEVTVVATSSALVTAGMQPAVSISNASGVFAFSDLPPGRYDLTFYYDRATEHLILDVEPNKVWPYVHWFTRAPRSDSKYLAQWSKQRIVLPGQPVRPDLETDGMKTNYVIDDHSDLFTRHFPASFLDGSFSSNCARGLYPCNPFAMRQR